MLTIGQALANTNNQKGRGLHETMVANDRTPDSL